MSNRFDELAEELELDVEEAPPFPELEEAMKIQTLPPEIPKTGEAEGYLRFDLDLEDEPKAEKVDLGVTIEKAKAEPLQVSVREPRRALERGKKKLEGTFDSAHDALFAAGPEVHAETHLDKVPFDDSPNAKFYRAARNSVTKYIYGFVSDDRYGALQNHTMAELVDTAFPDVSNWRFFHTPFGERCWWEAPIDCEGFLKEAIEANREMLIGKRQLHGYSWADDIDDFTKEQVRAHIVARNAQGGNGNAEFGLKIEVMVCKNGMHCQLPDTGKCKIKHTTRVEERAKLATQALRTAQQKGAELQHQFTLFNQTSIGAKAIDAFCRDVLGYDAVIEAKKKRKNVHAEKRAELVRNNYTAAPGARPGTLLGLVQATTYYTNHQAEVKIGGRNDRRFPDHYSTEDRVDAARSYSLNYGTSGQYSGASLNERALNWARVYYTESATL